ncbi:MULTISPECIES: DUF6361 family protein [Burkholderia]|uniref:DUF6361 family protein n=1 Tax=Burkholderia TaxID=32008 RepID=UPI00064F0C5D|nr:MULTISPECIES: DUF6361 family protein [Burkholderia]KML21261.1 hypothetical protein VL00_03315 [Burkholderia cepacia]KMN54053.1 hypothetical protein VK92_27635 [Burkholderia sp. LK4]
MAKAQNIIGWVLVSKHDVAEAERALLDESKGVRDELGILQLHQVISDTLFPGTSVLHTRLRYALFVPWMMMRAAEDSPRSPGKALEQLEVRLTKKLVDGLKDAPNADGVIGRRKYPNPASQPPSFSYWTALSAWGLLSPRFRGLTRDQVLRHLIDAKSTLRSGVKDEQGRPLSDAPLPFASLPREPDSFWDESPDTFDLRPDESTFLKKHLGAVVDTRAQQSLLSNLAITDKAPTADRPWLDLIVHSVATDQHKQMLEFARRCSSLGGVCRALYLAMVERHAADIGFGSVGPHRDRLRALLEEHADTAISLDLNELSQRGIKFLPDDPLPQLFTETQEWIRGRKKSVDALLPCYRSTERYRKKGRARLGETDVARARLALWAEKEAGAQAEPLHFRWNNVRQLLVDLHAAPEKQNRAKAGST